MIRHMYVVVLGLTIILTGCGGTTVSVGTEPTVVSENVAVTATPVTELTAKVSEWADGMRIQDSNVFANPWTTSTIPFTFKADSEVVLHGHADPKWGFWFCVSQEDKWGWMAPSQLKEVPKSSEDLPVLEVPDGGGPGECQP